MTTATALRPLNFTLRPVCDRPCYRPCYRYATDCDRPTYLPPHTPRAVAATAFGLGRPSVAAPAERMKRQNCARPVPLVVTAR